MLLLKQQLNKAILTVLSPLASSPSQENVPPIVVLLNINRALQLAQCNTRKWKLKQQRNKVTLSDQVHMIQRLDRQRKLFACYLDNACQTKNA